MTAPRCIQWVAVPGPQYTTTRPCSRPGTHRTPGGSFVCAQHARRYDLTPQQLDELEHQDHEENQ